MNLKKILFLVVLFFISPFIVHAVDYDIDDFYIRAYIQDNGDMQVHEIIVMNGSFNGYQRDLSYLPILSSKYESTSLYQASDIEDIVVQGKYISTFSESLFQDKDYTIFSEVNSASSGVIGKYIKTNLYNGYRLRMYHYANHQKVAFYITYTLKNVVVLHGDFAEIYWPFIGENFDDELSNVDIKVTLPNTSSTTYFRAWAHGPLYGDLSLDGTIGVSTHLDSVSSNEALDIRMTFDKNLMKDTSELKTSTTSFQDVLNIELKKAEDADALREELLKKYNFVKYSTIGLYLSMFVLGIFIYFKYAKSPKSLYYSKYNREFIDDYNVEVIDYLMNRKITPNAMSASIMNLIYKKNISAEEIVNNSKSKKKDYVFTLESMDNINESEQILIDFLFHKVGKSRKNGNGKQEFTTMDLKAYASGTKTCETFISSYTKWKNHVLNVGKNEQFFETSATPKIIGVIILLLSFFIFVLTMEFGVDFVPSYFVLFVSIFFLIYTIVIYKKTKKGVEHYDKWKAFKNFLNDFGTFDLKELPEIVLWERYLVYATIFGLASRVQKSMNVKIKELDISDSSYGYYPSFYYFDLGPTIHSSVNSAVSSAYSRQAANYANSHSSSSGGSGFGGGFSGGSGFSGGGGGRGF